MGTEKKTQTREQRVILLVANWLKRYSQIYPMYGKTLEDLPERPKEFLDEFRKENPDDLDWAFKAARGVCTEFPTPAHVRAQLERVPHRVQHERLLGSSMEVLSRDAKPEGWEPLTAAEAKQALEKIRSAS